MSLASVIPYFDDKMQALGYIEWLDEFNIDNIPRDLLDRSYHIQIGAIGGSPAQHTSFEYSFPVTITVHSCPSPALGSSEAANEMMIAADRILEEMLIAEDRYSGDLKKIEPASITFSPISASNDNIIRVTIVFGVQLNIEYRRVCPEG